MAEQTRWDLLRVWTKDWIARKGQKILSWKTKGRGEWEVESHRRKNGLRIDLWKGYYSSEKERERLVGGEVVEGDRKKSRNRKNERRNFTFSKWVKKTKNINKKKRWRSKD